jgi:hypothetical protein
MKSVSLACDWFPHTETVRKIQGIFISYPYQELESVLPLKVSEHSNMHTSSLSVSCLHAPKRYLRISVHACMHSSVRVCVCMYFPQN